MHIAWSRDERPVWRVRCMYEVVPAEDTRARKLEYLQFQQLLGATGTVRVPYVARSGREVHVVMHIRGEDEGDAMDRALAVVDVAAAQVPRLKLGALVYRSVTPPSPDRAEDS